MFPLPQGCIPSLKIHLVQVVMLVWSYFASVCVDPGQVPPGWQPFAEGEVNLSSSGIFWQCLDASHTQT